MLISEPTTMLTDYAIAAEALVFAISLLWAASQRRQISIGFWAAVFACVLVAASAGGTYHGFTFYLSPAVRSGLWLITLYFLSFASFWVLVATITSTIPPRWQLPSLALVSLKFLLYIKAVTVNQGFGYGVAEYLFAMLIILILQSWNMRRHRQPSVCWFRAGILVSAAGTIVQLSGFVLSENFNYNDLYHLIQMIALYLFYRGARLLKDW